MRIVLDATAGARPDPSGIGRYVQELVLTLPHVLGDGNVTLGLRFSKMSGRHYLPRSGDGEPLPLRLLDDRLDRWSMRGFDVFHGPDARLTPATQPARVATVHDVFSLQHPDLARPSFREKKLRRYADIATHADRIICVSEVTRKAFLQHHPEAEERTRVVHHGIADRFRPAAKDEVESLLQHYHIRSPYVLFVGLLNSRKNLPTLLRAFDAVAKDVESASLVIAGKESHGYDEIGAALESLDHKDRVHRLDFVPAEDLPTLITGARALALPSRAEGFGFPILEAYACGTAVLSSDLPVLQEVGGELLRMAPWDRVDAFEAHLRDLFASEPVEEERAKRVEWAQRFTWQRCGEKTAEVYREAVAAR